MEDKEKNIFTLLRNQILAIAIVACVGGLSMNFLFMYSINNTINNLVNEQREQKQDIKTLSEKIYELKLEK